MSLCRKHVSLRGQLLNLLIVATLLACCGCQAVVSRTRPALAEEGELFLYLEPLPAEASRLLLETGEVAALRSDGVEIPLGLRLPLISAATCGRQRFLASGTLPPGSYQGITLKLRRAALLKPDGEIPLATPEQPERYAFPFEVKLKKATLLSLSLRNKEGVKPGAQFRPSISIVIPQKPLITLTGYVTNFGANTITVFDKKAGSVLGVIETGLGPQGVVFDQKKQQGYVSLSGEDAIEVIDLLSGEIVNRIRLIFGDRPGEIALTPDGKTLLCVNTGSNSLSFLDPGTLLETARVTVGKVPVSILLDASGSKAYVLNYLSNSMSVVDIAGKTVVGTLQTEAGPLRAAFNRAGDKLLVIHEWSPNLVVIDALSNAILKRVYVGLGMISLKVDAVTDRIYLGRRHDSLVQVFDPFSMVASDFLIAAGGPGYFFLDADSSNVLLLLPDQSALQAISLVSKRVQYLVDVDGQPFRSTMIGER